jgi:hypothetical protein
MEHMKLSIPLEIQKKDSLDCGIISLLMVFKYFGIKKSFKDIQKDLKVDKVGTYAPQMGTFMLKNGFNSVEIITQHPGIFTIKDRGKSQKQILSQIEELLLEEEEEQNRKVLNYFVEFLKNGGKVKVKIPGVDDIQKGIKEKTPMIALLTTNFLTELEPEFNFHFNVITGIDKDFVYLNDPSPNQDGGRKKCRINDFLFGLYAASYGDLDNGSLLKISKD